MAVDSLMHSCVLDLGVCSTIVDLCVLSLGSYNVVLGIDFLEDHQDKIDCSGKRVQCLDDGGERVESVGV